MNYRKNNQEITKRLLQAGKHNNPKVKERHINQFEFIKKYLRKKWKILEIGCREGGFLRLLKENGYIDIIGIDISQEAIDICSQEFKCYCMDALSINNSTFSGKFDYIHMSHVLEHVPKPGVLIKNLYNLLKNRGFILVEVPLQKETNYNIVKNGHYSFFNKEQDLRKIMKGFEILKGEIENKNHYRILCKKGV